MDSYGQIVLNDFTSLLQIVVGAAGYISHETVRASGGIYYLDNIRLSSKPGEIKNITVKTDGIPNFINSNEGFSINLKEFTVEANFTHCGIGYILSNETCNICPLGTFHVNLESDYMGTCSICQPGMYCLGGSKIGPEKGYFRLNQTSDIFLKCPFKDSCLGGVFEDGSYIGEGRCDDKYKGNLCAKCNSGYGLLSYHEECTDCGSDYRFYLLFSYQ